MKRVFVAAAAAGLFAFTGSAWAACPATPGDSAVITVPKGKALRVMIIRLRPEMNYLEICIRDVGETEWRGQGSLYPFRREWTLMWEHYTQPADYQLNIFGDQVDDRYAHRPWAGVRRVNTPTGYTLSWYGADGPDKPTTMVEVCLWKDIRECPSH